MTHFYFSLAKRTQILCNFNYHLPRKSHLPTTAKQINISHEHTEWSISQRTCQGPSKILKSKGMETQGKQQYLSDLSFLQNVIRCNKGVKISLIWYHKEIFWYQLCDKMTNVKFCRYLIHLYSLLCHNFFRFLRLFLSLENNAEFRVCYNIPKICCKLQICTFNITTS